MISVKGSVDIISTQDAQYRVQTERDVIPQVYV